MSRIKLRKIKKDDLELLLAWRNHPKNYKYRYEQKGEIIWEEHLNWFNNRNDRVDWLIIYEERKVGCISIIHLDSQQPDIGVYIGETTLWGKGVAKESVELAIDWLKNGEYKSISACVMKENKRSIRLWESLGFEKTEEIYKGNGWKYVGTT